jgi:hypothetical protein
MSLSPGDPLQLSKSGFEPTTLQQCLDAAARALGSNTYVTGEDIPDDAAIGQSCSGRNDPDCRVGSWKDFRYRINYVQWGGAYGDWQPHLGSSHSALCFVVHNPANDFDVNPSKYGVANVVRVVPMQQECCVTPWNGWCVEFCFVFCFGFLWPILCS